MEMHVKRKVLAAGSALALTGVAVGGLAVTEQVTARHSAADRHGAAPAVRGQRVDLSTPSPSASKSRRIYIKVKNFGAFLGELCVQNGINGHACTPDILVDTEPAHDTPTELTATIKPTDTYADIRGWAGAGAETHLYVSLPETDLSADPPAHCFRFDGSSLAGFRFTKVDCKDLQTPVNDFTTVKPSPSVAPSSG